MNRQTSTWGHSSYKLRQEEERIDFFYLLGLLVAALILFSLHLGNLPLRDWDEGTVAQVAKEIWQAPQDSWKWLFPTLWDSPYLNKPPLIHGLIALTYRLFGLQEWTSRLPSAMLTACSVPLLYLLGREIFPSRLPALFSALVYLMLLPVVRQGRLAMLDGAVLCFEILMIICVLRSRRDLRWSLGAGFSFSLLCLTKGIMGVLLGGIIFLFLAWDTPRLLTSAYFWFGWFLGSTPAIAWYIVQWLRYEQQFMNSLFAQQIVRVNESLDNHQGAPWFYFLEIFKYSCPWLIFAVWGFRLAWQDRYYSWAKLILVWSGSYLLVVSLMATKLPWYIIPLYPAFALAAGYALAQVRNLPIEYSYPSIWTIIFGILSVISGLATLAFYLDFFANWLHVSHPFFGFILIALSLTMGTVAILIGQRSEQFISVLFWGIYVTLLLFVSSPYWIWELNEAYAVKPVAQLIQQKVPLPETVYTSFEYERPSLNFYSDHRILPVSPNQLWQHWRTSDHPYFLIDEPTLSHLNLSPIKVLGESDSGWLLITK